MQHLRMIRPDDWHVHLRDQELLKDTVPATAKHFSRALVMPNLKPALTNIETIEAYRQRIIANLATTKSFTPLMTLYLNAKVEADTLTQLRSHPYILGAKFYPAGATTNAEAGAESIRRLYPLLDLMQENDLVLQLHGEVTSGDIFAREALFIEDYLRPLVQDFPRLRIVLEHISTQAAVEFVLQAPHTVAATITPHHLSFNRNQLLAGGIRPHFYCLPILKKETDQLAVQQAAVSGNPKFFAGTDSAPHARSNKESTCGCAGIYSAPYALAMYAQVFESLGKLPQLEPFLSHFGALFYQQSLNTEEIELIKTSQRIPQSLPLGREEVIPVLAGETLPWSVYEPV